MRVVLVDYSGHAFQVQLSRALAALGHDTLHLYFQEFQSPHGKLEKVASDPQTFDAKPVSIGKPFSKYSMLRRRLQEQQVGKAFASQIRAFSPDIVIACNCPLDCAREMQLEAQRAGCSFVFWQQDIYSSAISRILKKRLGFLGGMIGAHYHRLERRIMAESDSIIVISQDFADAIREDFGIEAGNIHVIENWAPLEDIPVRSKTNDWSIRNGLAENTVVLYSGTIGLKHDPQKLLDVAARLRDHPEARVVVVSEGPYADWLKMSAEKQSLTNLTVLPFQHYADFPDVLGSADITVAVLEEDAGAFSVPSKILSYLCSGRPIVLSAPGKNLASRIVEGCGAGYVVDPDNTTKFVEAVRMLVGDKDARTRAGRNGRNYAEATFNIDLIASRFAGIIGLEGTGRPQ